MGITYRPEIDGLRAISVVSVVLYHAGVGGAGFVGVDVFFVISGYLITSLLLDEFNRTQAIDFMAFYAKRVRRILPALIVVVLATVVASTFLLSLAEMKKTASSAGAAMAFVANIFFQSTTGSYFDGRAEEMPLLHLWSLSVEEQFYLAWPAILLMLLRFRPDKLQVLVVVLGAGSFALAQTLVLHDPESAFYQMPARLWELAAGGFIAATPRRNVPKWVMPVGLALLVIAVVKALDPFPASGALPVVAGASLVIAAVHGGATNKFLAAKPMVAIGLVSYSLYLWHWPLLALYRATSIGEGRLDVRLYLCAAALVLAAATYRYVEQPLRRGKLGSRPVVVAGVSTAVFLVVAAVTFGALPQLKDDHRLAARAENDLPPRVCHTKTLDPPVAKCLPRPSSRVGIWGDSMAYSWTPAIWRLDPNAIAFTRDACAPVVDYLPTHSSQADRDCRTYNSDVAFRIRRLETLVLVAMWQPDDPRLAGLQRTLEVAAPRVGRVILLGPTPTLKDDVPRCLRQDRVAACAVSRPEFDRHAQPILASLRQVAARYPNVIVVDLGNDFCDASQCPAVLGGVPLYWDSHHISMSISRNFDLSATYLGVGKSTQSKVKSLD